jgi:acyl-CoA synthetase (AMP-forming)/AMP-acid ligase II
MIDLEGRYETLTVESPAEGVVQVTLNRPDRLNAMTVGMFDELESLARTIAEDRDIWVVILTGAGRAFCAGYDLDETEELPALSALGMLDRQERAARALSAVRALPVPVIAAVNGPAAGGGMSLTLMADIRLGSSTGNSTETAALFTPDGFSKSGDLGRMTDDGYLRVTGRTKDIVIRGGMNISVREIEDHLAHHPALQAYSVVGMPDERLGKRVCCFVVTAAGHDTPTVEHLREFLIEKGVPIQKTPERIVAVAGLPMTAIGKVLKHELRRDIEQRLEAEATESKEAAGAN